jgi:hypothetical protein
MHLVISLLKIVQQTHLDVTMVTQYTTFNVLTVVLSSYAGLAQSFQHPCAPTPLRAYMLTYNTHFSYSYVNLNVPDGGALNRNYYFSGPYMSSPCFPNALFRRLDLLPFLSTKLKSGNLGSCERVSFNLVQRSPTE